MKVLIQRVSEASVSINGEMFSNISQGLLIFLGVEKGDTAQNAEWLAEKISSLRIFADAEDKMNLSLLDIKGAALIVSQFTLAGDCQKGRRLGFEKAASPKIAEELYEYFIARIKEKNIKVETGQFAAKMNVALINDGPVTFLIENSSQCKEI